MRGTGASGRRQPLLRGTALAAAALLVITACGDDDDASRSDATPPQNDEAADTTDVPDTDLEDVDLTLTEVAEFDEPLDLVSRPGDHESLYVAERDGRVFRLEVEGEGTERSYTAAEEPLLDLRDEVIATAEQGLLGIEFSPDGERLYASYSLDPSGETRIVAYDFTESDDDAAEDEVATGAVDEDSRREVLAVDQPYPNHNGGQIRFGPDGYLYVGLGDGGAGGDPEEHGQDTSTLLGSLLRIDPESTAEADEPYAIPEDNPFADGAEGEPEIWAYGLRNPWRFSFDAVTGDLWIADVGQNEWEEINLLPQADEGGRGANLGWNEMEGTHPFEGGSNPDDGVLPIFDYPIPDEGCAVTGGYVYSGNAIPALDAVYLFGDYCNPTLRALSVSDGELTGSTWLEGIEVENLVAFGEDQAGELHLLSQNGTIYRLDP